MNITVGYSESPASTGVVEGSSEILDRLQVCLVAVAKEHDLGRQELRATERAIRRLDKHGMACTANEFWETTALPRAQRLISGCTRVIERELLLLAANEPDYAPDKLAALLPSTEAINDLGFWWQRRLRRRALLRTLPAIMTNVPAQTEFLIANAEMALLDTAPWSHGDRLLSAFELAHGEIARFGRRQVDALFATPDASQPLATKGQELTVGGLM